MFKKKIIKKIAKYVYKFCQKKGTKTKSEKNCQKKHRVKKGVYI